MSKDNEAVELLREWYVKRTGELTAEKRELRDRTCAFLSEHDISDCCCGVTPKEAPSRTDALPGASGVLYRCECCGLTSSASSAPNIAIKNWNFTVRAIHEKRAREKTKRDVEETRKQLAGVLYEDLMGKKCSECGK